MRQPIQVSQTPKNSRVKDRLESALKLPFAVKDNNRKISVQENLSVQPLKYQNHSAQQLQREENSKS